MLNSYLVVAQGGGGVGFRCALPNLQLQPALTNLDRGQDTVGGSQLLIYYNEIPANQQLANIDSQR